MILPNRIRPDLLASTSEGRYAMHHVLLDLRGPVPRLEATDGRILGSFDLEMEEGEAFPLDDFEERVEMIALDRVALGKGLAKGGESGEHRLRLVDPELEWRPGTRREFEVVVVAPNGKERVAAKVAASRIRSDEWPKSDMILDSARSRPTGSWQVCVNPEFLGRLARSAGGLGVVRMELGSAKDPIRLWTDGFEGLIMPITLEV